MHTPDWNLWRYIPWVEPWQAVALALNLDPDSLDYRPDSGWGSGGFTGREGLPDRLTRAKFAKRLRIIEANLESRAPFRWKGDRNWDATLALPEFVKWAMSVWDDLPPELVALAREPDSPKNTPKAPEDWEVKAVQIANRIGQERWTSGQRQITARNICEAVAMELAKDSTTHGAQGQRGADNVRTNGLKGWKFLPQE